MKKLLTQAWIVMRLATLFLLAGTLHLSAASYSQTVTLSAKQASIHTILRAIEQQTGYVAFSSEELLKSGSPVTVTFNHTPIEKALQTLFNNQPLTYEIKDKNILIKERSVKPSAVASKHDGQGRKREVISVSAFPEVQGRVADSLGNPLQGASVRVFNTEGQRTTLQTTTDREGYFILRNVPEGARLRISYIGYVDMEIPPAANVGTVVLRMLPSALEEVEINAGYYKVKDRERTGSISRVTAKEIETQPVISPILALQGRMPGVELNEVNGMPGANPVIRIRGRNSLRDDGNLPLYIVDGVPISALEVDAFGLYAISGVDPLSALNPANIESIEVLKDADATAIYGSRGANGVVLITTKKGSAGSTRLNLNAYSGVGTIPKKLDLLSTADYLEMRREAFSNESSTPTAANSPDLVLWDQNRYTDWQEELLGNTTSMSDLQASLSGGSENTSFLFGLGHHAETMVFPGDFGYKKFTGNLNVNHHSSNDRFRFVLSSGYGADVNNNFDASRFVENAIKLAPNAPTLYNADGSLNWEGSTWSNPAADLRKTQSIHTENLVINSVVQYEVFSKFWAKLNMGYTTYHSDALAKNPISSKDPAFKQENNVQRDVAKRVSYILEPQFNYSISFDKNGLDALAGATFQKSNSNRLLTSGQGFVDERMMDNFAGAERQSFLLQDDREYAYIAVFGRLGYNWDHTFFINLTGRRDGSSRFGPGRQFGNFGAAGAAWIFSNADFVQQALPFLSFGKVRGSYGTTGNDQIADYGYYDTYQPTNGTSGLYPTQLANPNYSWEVNKKLEFAGDFGFFRDRLMFSASWYRNRSSSQLVGYSLPALTGFPSVQANLPATVENRGWELQLMSKNVLGTDFNWETSFNITFPKNELLEYQDLEESSYANRYRVGHSLDSRLSYHSLGVDPETGLYEMEDINGDGRFNYDDRTVIQDMGNKYYGGLNNNISYKRFNLVFFIQFVKQKGRNYLSLFSTPGREMLNQPVLDMDRWREVGDISEFQRFSGSSAAFNAYNRAAISDRSISDASFIRLRTISLSYQLPSAFISGLGLESARVYLHGQNLLTITDPLSASYGTLANLPPLKNFTAGIQLTFR